jgi:hypothetical protein
LKALKNLHFLAAALGAHVSTPHFRKKLADTHVLRTNRSRTNRSRVSNGKELFFEAVDGRSALARRYRDVLAQLVR